MLTKPLGIGAITTGAKRGIAADDQVARAIAVMTSLNAGAAAAAREIGIGSDRPVHAGTDVTGFGLLGHLREMTSAADVGAMVEVDAVPTIPGARDLLEAGAVAGGTQRNHAWVSAAVQWGETSLVAQHLLADAQTSGGLLLACDPGATDQLVAALGRHGALVAARIGRITPSGPITIV